MKQARRAAIVLAGCGRADGSEVLEAASIMFALHKNNVPFRCFAPNRDAAETIDHLSGKRAAEKRNMLAESARICRGEVEDLQGLRASAFDMLLLPGGSGVAKNLCDFASRGDQMTVEPALAQAIKDFAAQGKPIGACCIAPILLAKVLPGVQITLGKKTAEFPFAEAITAAEGMGARHVEADQGEICVDEGARVVTTPAFMKDGENWYKVYQGNELMVEKLVQLCSQGPDSHPAKP